MVNNFQLRKESGIFKAIPQRRDLVQQVSMVLAKIVTTGKSKLKTVYDPTCGSGSLLLRVAKEVKEVSNFYGQETVDIASVAKQLRSLEKEVKNTDAELTAFCKELKIDTPF